MSSMNKQRLIVGISGASGIDYGIAALKLLQNSSVESHLILSPAAEKTLAIESDVSLTELKSMADQVHAFDNIAATIASGSFKTLGMLIAPCSIRTLSEIHTGVTSSLMSRAADVVLKERRRLVLMVRETPLHTGHLRTMTALSEIGAVIAPPVPAMYSSPTSIDDMITQSSARMLDLFDIDTGALRRWGE